MAKCLLYFYYLLFIIFIIFVHFTNQYITAVQVFQANTDTNTVVANTLPAPVLALCLRVYPQTWYDWPELRMDVLGCPSA